MPRTQQRNRASIALLLIASLLAACGPSNSDIALPPILKEMRPIGVLYSVPNMPRNGELQLIGDSKISDQSYLAILELNRALAVAHELRYTKALPILFSIPSSETFISAFEYYGAVLEKHGFEPMTDLNDIVQGNALGADNIYIAGWSKRDYIFIMYTASPMGSPDLDWPLIVKTNIDGETMNQEKRAFLDGTSDSEDGAYD